MAYYDEADGPAVTLGYWLTRRTVEVLIGGQVARGEQPNVPEALALAGSVGYLTQGGQEALVSLGVPRATVTRTARRARRLLEAALPVRPGADWDLIGVELLRSALPRG